MNIRSSLLWCWLRKFKQQLLSVGLSDLEKSKKERKELIRLSDKTLKEYSSYFIQGRMDIDPLGSWHNPEFEKETGGFLPRVNSHNKHIIREFCDLESYDNVRKDMIALLLRTIIENDTFGDFAELGVYKGHTAKLIHYFAPERKLHLFDTFTGFHQIDLQKENKQIQESESINAFKDTSIEGVKNFVSMKNNNVFFHKGYFPDTIPTELFKTKFAFVHLDADLYQPTLEGLKFFYERLSKKGIILCHDYNSWPGSRKAIDEFLVDKAEIAIPMPDKSGSAIIVKH